MRSCGKWFGLIAVVSLVSAQVRAAASDAVVTVTPEETDEILANPGMGWETFHRTSKADKNLPSWIPSTVHYARWGWRELEPQPGKIDYDVPGQGAQGVARFGAEAGVPGDVLLDDPRRAISSRMAQRHRWQGTSRAIRAGGRSARSPTWMIPSFWVATSISSSGWASVMTGIPTSTMLISARWAGGASGT